MILPTSVRALPKMAVVLAAVLSFLALPAGAQTQQFNDVPPEYWAFDFINTLADSGVTAGCGDGNYCPEDLVTRAQMAVFLERGIQGSDFVPPPASGALFGDVAANDFAANFIEQLAADGITAGCGNGNYCPNDSVTRAQMAVFLERSMNGSDYLPPPATGVFGDVGVDDFAADFIEQLAADGITAGCGNGNYCPNDPVTRAQMAVFLVRTFNLDVVPPLLTDLNVSGATLEQTFDPDTNDYSAVTGFLVDTVTVDATPEAGATVEIDGVSAGPGGVPVTLEEGVNDVEIVVTAADGMTTNTYALTVVRQTAEAFAQIAYVKASNTGAGDEFGYAVAVSGDTLVVGAPIEDSNATGINGDQTNNNRLDSGAVYVFVRDGDGVWAQQAYVKASNTGELDTFGISVAIDGDTLAVGAYREFSAATGVDGNQADDSAFFAGAVYVYTRDAGGVWSQQAYIKASNTGEGDLFGTSVALDGDTLAVGADGEDSSATGINGDETDNTASAAGAVYVFTRGGGTWAQQAYVKASNTGAGDGFGRSVSLSGDTLVVGAPGEDSAATGIGGDEMNNSATDAGAAYVFTRDAGGIWSQQAYVKSTNTDPADEFAIAVALSSDTLAVGAYVEASAATGVDGDQTDNSALGAGAVYMYARNSGSWAPEAYLKAFNTDGGDLFGVRIAIDGNQVAVGAFGEDSAASGVGGDEADDSAGSAGAVYLFSRDPVSGWSQTAYVKASNPDVSDFFGWSVAIDGNLLAVTARNEASAATGVGGDQADNSVGNAGAAYVFGGVPSRETSLTSIDIDGVELDQVFQPEVTDYTADATFLTTGVDVGAISEDPNAVVRINGQLVDANAPVGVDLAEGSNVITIEVLAEDGVTTLLYTITVDRESAAQFAQNAYLKATNAEAGDRFGYATALYGDTLVVGAPEESSAAVGVNGNASDNSALGSGAVYVFDRDSGGVWSQVAYVKASNTGAGDQFGWAIALSADLLAVGAPGEDSAATGINGNQISNAAAGAGAVYVFRRGVIGDWIQEAYVKASNTESLDEFGSSVALDGETLVVGAWSEDSAAVGINGDGNDNSAADAGAAYVFIRDAGVWSQQAYIKASNTDALDEYGRSVAISGDTLAVGAFGEASAATGINGNEADNSAAAAGAVYVYTRSAGVWTQQAYVKASNAEAVDGFGRAVALDDATLAVGAFLEDSGATGVGGSEADNGAGNAGAVYVFTRDAGVWSQQAYVKPSNTESLDEFGRSVVLSGDALAVGAYREDSAAFGVGGNEADNSASSSGAAYLFLREAGVWSQKVYAKASNSGAQDEFGWSVVLDGDALAVGAWSEDSAATGIGGNEADDTAADAGAVYTFD